MDPYIQVLTTTDGKEEAVRIAEAVIDRRLGACVQIIGPVMSTYWWKGRIEKAEEWQCLIKSRKDRFPALEAAIKAIHSYETPEIIATAISEGSREYLAWLRDELDAP